MNFENGFSHMTGAVLGAFANASLERVGRPGCRGVFDAKAVLTQLPIYGETATDPTFSGPMPVFSMADGDAEGLTRNEAVVIRRDSPEAPAEGYSVREWRSDGMGVTVVLLKRRDIA